MSSPTEFTALARRLLSEIAPDADTDSLALDADIRDTLDIDSVDFLNFVARIHAETGVDIPERDYPRVATLAAIAVYLDRRA